MKPFYYLVLACAIATSICACSEEDFKTFGGEVAGIYLQLDANSNYDNEGNLTSLGYADSMEVSFASSKSDVTSKKAYIMVKTIGNVTDYDRPFILKVDESKSTGIRGTHFDFNEADCVIKANTAKTNVFVTIYRTEDLLTHTLRAEFYLEPNEYFTTEMQNYKNTDNWQAVGDTLHGTRYKIIFTEQYTEPFYWTMFGTSSLGDWSASKEKRVNALMGWTHYSWEKGGDSSDPTNVQYGHIEYAAKLLRKELQELADAGTPVVDDNGEYMQLAPGFEVDYSAYE